MTTTDAIMLAGGTSRRMHGTDKCALVVGGQPLLDYAIGAVADSRAIVAVGPRRETRIAVRWTREEPPGGGPVAGLAAGMRELDQANPGHRAQFVRLIACDMPLAGDAMRSLTEAAAAAQPGIAAVLAVGPDGRDQPLLAVWRTDALAALLDARPEHGGQSMRSLIARADPAQVVRISVAPDAVLDCDDAADLSLARSLLAP